MASCMPWSAQHGVAVNPISVGPLAVARVFAIVVSFLVIAHLAGQFSKLELGHGRLYGLVPLFDMDQELNVPTYFSVLLMLFTALLTTSIALLHRKQGAPQAWKWLILSLGFLYMSFDEAFSLHERLSVPVRSLISDTHLVQEVGGETVFGVFYFAWVLLGMAMVLVVGLYFWKFLLHLPAAARRHFVIAAALYLAGAIGCELLGGRYAEQFGQENWTYTLIMTTEETLELVGLVVFTWALLRYCADHYGEVRFVLES